MSPGPSHLKVADDAVRLRGVQPARRGHRELLCSADEKVAGGWVAATLRAAVAELGFLSEHSGFQQGCTSVRGWGLGEIRSEPEQKEQAGAATEWIQKKAECTEKETQWRDEREKGREGKDAEKRIWKHRHHLRFVQRPRASRPP